MFLLAVASGADNAKVVVFAHNVECRRRRQRAYFLFYTKSPWMRYLYDLSSMLYLFCHLRFSAVFITISTCSVLSFLCGMLHENRNLTIGWQTKICSCTWEASTLYTALEHTTGSAQLLQGEVHPARDGSTLLCQEQQGLRKFGETIGPTLNATVSQGRRVERFMFPCQPLALTPQLSRLRAV